MHSPHSLLSKHRCREDSASHARGNASAPKPPLPPTQPKRNTSRSSARGDRSATPPASLLPRDFVRSSSLQLSPQPKSVTAKNPARAVKPFIAANARKLSSSRPKTRKAPKPTASTPAQAKRPARSPTRDSPAGLSPPHPRSPFRSTRTQAPPPSATETAGESPYFERTADQAARPRARITTLAAS
jgi:hypothetical protein